MVGTALALFLPFWRRLFDRPLRWLDFVPSGLVASMVVQILADGFQAYMVATYTLVVLLFLVTLRRAIRPNLPVKRSKLRTVLSLAAAVLGIVSLALGIWSGPMAVMAAGDDLSGESWTAAFDRMNDMLAQRYAFTGWKGIDWDELHAEFRPRIAAAEEAGDRDAYHLALREYIFSIPDGHLVLNGDDAELWRASIGGGYGLAVIELDDGSVIAHVVQEGGPAESAGMTWGAKILEWDGVPAREAIGEVPPIWAASPPATQEGRRTVQQNLLTRAPVGTEVTLTFQNLGEDAPRTVTLTAVDDGREPLYQSMGWRASMGMRSRMGEEVDDSATLRPPEYEILPEGYGYIKVYHLRPQEDDPDYAGIVEEALREFMAQDVRGVIIDVRGNPGGDDWLVTGMMGYFFSEPDFYEYMYVNNWQTGLGLFDFRVPLGVQPKEPHYGGPVAVLVDQHTVSSGEGFALLAQQLPQGQVVGVYGTHGSFGMCCGGIKLPGDCDLVYPPGQSRDADGHVQLDGNQNLAGGVTPDVRVPLTRETVYAMFVEGEDVVLQYAMEALGSD
jgi:carboxyl-terminal processing protease